MRYRIFNICISAADWWYLKHGDKCFIVIPEPYPGLHYGDTLRLAYRGGGEVLERWVKYAESGIHLLPDFVAIELAVGASPILTAELETEHETGVSSTDEGRLAPITASRTTHPSE